MFVALGAEADGAGAEGASVEAEGAGAAAVESLGGASAGGAANARPDATHAISTNDPLAPARIRRRLSRARRACAIQGPDPTRPGA